MYEPRIESELDFSLARAHTKKEGIKELRRGSGGNISTIKGCRYDTQKIFEALPIPLLLRTDSFIKAWADWVEYRTKQGTRHRWPNDPRCFGKSLVKCEQWGPDRSIVAIDHSIEMGYRGLFEPLKFEPRKFHKEQPKPKHVNGTIHTGVKGRIF